MEELTAVDKERLYRLVYWKIKELEKQLEDTGLKELQEQLKDQIEEYKELLKKIE